MQPYKCTYTQYQESIQYVHSCTQYKRARRRKTHEMLLLFPLHSALQPSGLDGPFVWRRSHTRSFLCSAQKQTCLTIDTNDQQRKDINVIIVWEASSLLLTSKTKVGMNSCYDRETNTQRVKAQSVNALDQCVS